MTEGKLSLDSDIINVMLTSFPPVNDDYWWKYLYDLIFIIIFSLILSYLNKAQDVFFLFFTTVLILNCGTSQE